MRVTSILSLLVQALKLLLNYLLSFCADKAQMSDIAQFQPTNAAWAIELAVA